MYLDKLSGRIAEYAVTLGLPADLEHAELDDVEVAQALAHVQEPGQHPEDSEEDQQSRAIARCLWRKYGVPLQQAGTLPQQQEAIQTRNLDQIRSAIKEFSYVCVPQITAASTTVAENVAAHMLAAGEHAAAIVQSVDGVAAQLAALRTEHSQRFDKSCDALFAASKVIDGRWQWVKRAFVAVVVLVLLLIVATFLAPHLHAQIDVIRFQSNLGASVGTVAAPFTFKAGANCTLSKSGSVVTFNCTSAGGPGGTTTINVNSVAATTQDPVNFQSGTLLTVTNPSAGNIKFDFSGTLAATKTAVAGSPLLSYDATTGAFTQGALTAAQVGALASSTVLPANEAGAANNFLSAYNSTTGAWTKAQPTWANINKGTSSVADITTRTCSTLSDAGTGCSATIANYVPTATTVNSHALSSNVVVTATDIGAATTTLGVVKMAAGCGAGNHISSIGAGGELTCSADAAGTGAAITGTPVGAQVALWASATNVEGNAGLTFDKTAAALSVVKAATGGSLKLNGATSGDITISPAAIAGTATALTLPAVTGTALVAATSTTATQAMFATTTAGAPGFRAIAAADLPAALANSTSINGTSVAASKTLVYTDTAILAAQMPALTGDVTTSAGAVATTLRSGLNVRTCEMHIWGTGASSVLQDTDDEVASCLNKWGVTFTVTYVGCWANAGSPTLMVTKTGGNNVLSGNLTCGTATFASGSLTVTTADKQTADGGTLDLSIVAAGGTATNIRVVIVGTI